MNHIKMQYFFIGRTGNEQTLFLYHHRQRRFFNITELKEGYSALPLGYDSQEKKILLEIKPYQEGQWWTANSLAHRGYQAPLNIGSFHLSRQKWEFFKLPFIQWLNPTRFFWSLSLPERHHFIVQLDSAKKRFQAPLQSGAQSATIFQGFLIKIRNKPVLAWIDFCAPQDVSSQCLWVSPLDDKRTYLPSLHATLPRSPRRNSQWALNQKGSTLALTLWEKGRRHPTHRWWKRLRDKVWHPLWKSTSFDPLANTVISLEGSNQTSFHFLSTKNDIQAQIQKVTIKRHKGKWYRTKPKAMHTLPYLSDLFALNKKALLVISQDGIREVPK